MRDMMHLAKKQFDGSCLAGQTADASMRFNSTARSCDRSNKHA
jgi:hypothetical protein